MSFTIAITGTRGAQGAAIFQAATAAGHQVRRVSRSEGGYDDPSKLASQLAGVDALIVTSPIDHRTGVRESMMQTIAKAAALADVKRIVFNKAATIFQGYNKPVAQNLANLRDILLAGSTPAVVLEPTVYLDNLAAPWAVEAMRQGALPYPAPRDAKISWVSHKTLGECAVAAAIHPELANRTTLRVGGAQALNGDELAAVVAKVLNQPVAYVQTPLDEFAMMLNSMAGAPAGDDIADYYRHLIDAPHALARTVNDASQLGVQPESARSWFERTLQG